MMLSDFNIKNILKERELAPNKRLGQNFLIHRTTADRIVEAAGVGSGDTILEIGVGFGALTRPLAERVNKVIGVEIDAGIIHWQRDKGHLPENVTLIHQDILKFDLQKLASTNGKPLKIVANLPYSISNPLLFKLIENHEVVEWAVLMVQKEVGQRLLAESGTRAYGVLSVLMKACATVTPLLEVGPDHFHPRPKVNSLVLRVTFHPIPKIVNSLPHYNRQLFKKLVNAAFQQRRKTLLNALSAGNRFGIDKRETEQLIEKAGISPSIRGEKLTIEDFVALAVCFNSRL